MNGNKKRGLEKENFNLCYSADKESKRSCVAILSRWLRKAENVGTIFLRNRHVKEIEWERKGF